MFWNKKPAKVPVEKNAGAAAAPKVKKLSPKETMVSQIEQLVPGQVLTYQIAKTYWENFAGFFFVELNPNFPEKGKKYLVSVDKIADGKPAGKKTHLWDTNKPQDIANAVLDRSGVLFPAA